MPIIYADSSDGHITRTTGNNNTAREASSGTVSASSTRSAYAVRAESFDGRRGLGYSYSRAFFAFDVSAISNATSVALKIAGYSSAGIGGLVVMRSDAFGGNGGSALAAGDFNQIVNWNGTAAMTGASRYSAAPGMNHNLWSVNGYNSIPLNSSAETTINNNNYILICVVDYTYDYLKVAPIDTGSLGSGALSNHLGLNFVEMGGVNRDPYLDITVQTSGFGHNVNGVSAASIGKVNSVATTSIGKIISVD